MQLFDPFEDLSWQDEASCLGCDPDLFFPLRGQSSEPAKQICAACSVREVCLEWAISHHEHFGIFGGLSERERKQVRLR